MDGHASHADEPSASAWLRPTLHPTYARLLCARLRQHGVEPAQLLEGARRPWQDALDSNRLIGLESFARLVRRGIRLTGRPWIGLEVGGMTLVSAHGPLGQAAVAARDTREALRLLCRYAPLRMRGLRMRLDERPDGARLEIRHELDLRDIDEYLACTITATVLRLIEATSASRPDSVRVRLAYAAPPWAEVYGQLLGCGVGFDADGHSLDIPGTLLDAPCPTADEEAGARARRDCERLMTAHSDSLAERVRDRLLAGDGHYPELADMAASLAMSRRTLIRRLKAEGSAYQRLLDEVRQDLATWYLQHTRLPVERIAEHLGYQSASNFSRSFRRWFGTTPGRLRHP